ncbi:hypothetical protein Y032_0173g415 [Ancylostoma ceylanicum]|nr:hypothetical protein Y032_0173g415 [Ancylostoma ceylanicum]
MNTSRPKKFGRRGPWVQTYGAMTEEPGKWEQNLEQGAHSGVDVATNPSLKRSYPDDSEPNPVKRCNIDGAMDASGMVQQMGFGGTSMIPTVASAAETVVEIISVPENTVGLVIGRGGSEIQNIQSTTGCRVQMSPDGDPSTGVRQCTLQGSKRFLKPAGFVTAQPKPPSTSSGNLTYINALGFRNDDYLWSFC